MVTRRADHAKEIEKEEHELAYRKEYIDHLKKVNDVFYDQIRIADQKAAYIFTFMLAFMVSSAEGRGVFKWVRYQEGDWPIVFCSAILAAAVVFSLLSAILVVLPRHKSEATSLYWGAWPRNRTPFTDAAERGDPDYLYHQYLDNVDNLAAISRAKYRFVGLSFRGLMLAVTAYVGLLLAG